MNVLNKVDKDQFWKYTHFKMSNGTVCLKYPQYNSSMYT